MSITLAVTSDAAHGVLVVRFLCLFFHTARHGMADPKARPCGRCLICAFLVATNGNTPIWLLSGLSFLIWQRRHIQQALYPRL